MMFHYIRQLNCNLVNMFKNYFLIFLQHNETINNQNKTIAIINKILINIGSRSYLENKL